MQAITDTLSTSSSTSYSCQSSSGPSSYCLLICQRHHSWMTPRFWASVPPEASQPASAQNAVFEMPLACADALQFMLTAHCIITATRQLRNSKFLNTSSQFCAIPHTALLAMQAGQLAASSSSAGCLHHAVCHVGLARWLVMGFCDWSSMCGGCLRFSVSGVR